MMRLDVAEGIHPAFVQHYLSSLFGKLRLTINAKWAVNQASINQQDVGSTIVPLPPTSEQARIAAEIDRLDSTASATRHIAADETDGCFRLRQSILKWAFEGKLVDQHPKDEPASVLLERIKAEREAGVATKKRANRRNTREASLHERH
jgi:type I restriction enzyme S subunit